MAENSLYDLYSSLNLSFKVVVILSTSYIIRIRGDMAQDKVLKPEAQGKRMLANSHLGYFKSMRKRSF